ncbi:hypothetical protein H7100_02970 [Candidatus Saccharibacteria bacterium]|nr:hypothetical protein [Candidatus Saccharibacteria bacterium]
MSELLPERNFSSCEDAVLKNTTGPTTSEVIILGEDTLYCEDNVSYILPEYNPDFIGPRNATNEASPLLENRARMLAQIAVINLSAYGREYHKVILATKASIEEGVLNLNTDFKNMSVDEQVESFVSGSVISNMRSHDEVAAGLKLEKERLRVSQNGPDKELQLELNATRDLVREQVIKTLAVTLEVRKKLVERGASDEFMREFDHTTKLMTQPDREVYELEKKLTPEAEAAPLVDTGEIKLFKMFKHVLSPSFGRRALQSIGILSPKSGPVTVVPVETTTR